MNIYWKDVENLLAQRNASRNEINAQHQLFNSEVFQIWLASEFGIITERTFLFRSKKAVLERTSCTISDLSTLDTYELIDFIEETELSFRQASTITPQQMALLGERQVDKVTRALMAGLDDTQDPIRYSLSAVVQTGFPYKRLQGNQHFERKNGDLTVTMSAPNNIGLPSGIYPRLAFVFICSEIVKTQSRKISLGRSLKHFVVDEMGRPWSTGKRGTAGKWREAITSLLATSFTITYKVKDEDRNKEGILLKNVSIADEASLWWDVNFDELQEAEINVSESFADALLKHATPLDIRAIRSLSELRSPLAFDLYCWLTYRYWKMEESNTPIVRIAWRQLHGQLGTNVQTVRHFIYETREALSEVKKVYPQATFNFDDDSCFVLISSPPHISPKRTPSQQQLSLAEG